MAETAEGTQTQRRTIRWAEIRWAGYSFLPALLLTSLLRAQCTFADRGFLLRSFFHSVLLITLWVWYILSVRPRAAREATPNPWLRRLDIALANVLVFLLIGEGTLWVVGRLRPSPLFWIKPSTIERLNGVRFEPGKSYFGFRLNSRGYHDHEFFTAGPSDFVVALLADSFGTGIVPYEYNFATIAEKALREDLDGYDRVAIHNFGVPDIGMEEYAYLLQTEVLQTKPSLVALCVFVGNDIADRFDLDETLELTRCVLQNWLLWRVPKRLWRLARERRRQGLNAARIGQPTPDRAAEPEYLHDPHKEPPTFSEEMFLLTESCRLNVCNPPDELTQSCFGEFYRGLAFFRARLGDRLLVVLIPDEFQVNDELFCKVIATKENSAAFQRHYPQERIREYCRTHGIELLDLLPALLEAQKEGRTYHLRDTHFNAHGNRVVAAQLAQAIVKHVQRLGKE